MEIEILSLSCVTIQLFYCLLNKSIFTNEYRPTTRLAIWLWLRMGMKLFIGFLKISLNLIIFISAFLIGVLIFMLLFKWNVETLFSFRFVRLCKPMGRRDSLSTNLVLLVLLLTFCSAFVGFTPKVSQRFSFNLCDVSLQTSV